MHIQQSCTQVANKRQVLWLFTGAKETSHIVLLDEAKIATSPAGNLCLAMKSSSGCKKKMLTIIFSPKLEKGASILNAGSVSSPRVLLHAVTARDMCPRPSRPDLFVCSHDFSFNPRVLCPECPSPVNSTPLFCGRSSVSALSSQNGASTKCPRKAFYLLVTQTGCFVFNCPVLMELRARAAVVVLVKHRKKKRNE